MPGSIGASRLPLHKDQHGQTQGTAALPRSQLPQPYTAGRAPNSSLALPKPAFNSRYSPARDRPTPHAPATRRSRTRSHIRSSEIVRMRRVSSKKCHDILPPPPPNHIRPARPNQKHLRLEALSIYQSRSLMEHRPICKIAHTKHGQIAAPTSGRKLWAIGEILNIPILKANQRKLETNNALPLLKKT